MNDDLVKKFKSNPKLKVLIDKYDIDDSVLQNNSSIIQEFLNDYTYCNSDEPLVDCKQAIKGVQQKLLYRNKLFYITTEKCNHWLFENKYYKIDKNIIYCDYDKREIRQTIGDYIEQTKLVGCDASIIKFFEEFKKTFNNKIMKGFYLYGKPGIGKTFLLKLLANTMATKDNRVIFVSVNKFLKIIKDTFNNNYHDDANYFYDKCCDVDVLILDDIGGEVVTDWSRDEILFGLLNYRMEKNLRTYFSSNFSLIQLEENYLNKKAVSSKLKNFDLIKTRRFTERIKALSYVINIKGENKRY
ncbi:primosomal protein DnaI [Spiroplasma corruscae]|uniref:Primosomal protein DnaI n=1 Tax=Spiroplasma corruscae TaxID=216934 RepID=A0A222EN69_9MOLU|nr:DnaA/Hda family protein [Spiroplasma corruscae]ASP27938.1 primosomal protein DnaI [Spiroplasma corruscae]